jgi:hypothetical protein
MADKSLRQRLADKSLKVEELQGFTLKQMIASDSHFSGGQKKLWVTANPVEGTFLYEIYDKLTFVNSTYDLEQAIEIYNSL